MTTAASGDVERQVPAFFLGLDKSHIIGDVVCVESVSLDVVLFAPLFDADRKLSGCHFFFLLWPVQQLGAAVEHYDVILTLGLHTTNRVVHTPICHVSLQFTRNNQYII